MLIYEIGTNFCSGQAGGGKVEGKCIGNNKVNIRFASTKVVKLTPMFSGKDCRVMWTLERLPETGTTLYLFSSERSS